MLGANLIYGGNYLIAKGVMPDKLGPSAFIFIRVVGASLLFWLIRMFIREKVDRSDLLRLVLCGLLGVATNQLLFFHGLNLTSPIDASIIITAIPVMVLIFSMIILKEKLTANKISHGWSNPKSLALWQAISYLVLCLCDHGSIDLLPIPI